MKFYTPLLLIFLILACIEKTDNYKKKIDRLSDEDLYSRVFLELNYPDSISEEVELYITKDKDTFFNQNKILKNNKIIKSESAYYDLNITKTKKENIYRGIITLHSKYENLKLNNKNRREIQFGYCNQNRDSIWLAYVSSKTDNKIEFEYENYYNNNLQGILDQLVERDTIINNKEMVNINRLNILVDNNSTTENLFLESYKKIKENKFTLDKSKFKSHN